MPVEQLTGAVSDELVDQRMLLDRIAAGDRAALESLFRCYYGPLACFLWRSFGRSDGVAEIVNETFMEIWRDVRSRGDSASVSAWVFGIAYRKALESLGQQRNPVAIPNVNYSSYQFIDAVNDTEISRGLRRGLGTLSFEQRCTLVLAYQVGCAIEEIAAITGVPVGSVKARMLCAREKLSCFIPACNPDSRSD
jgi:RNA polymerase sigma-70 factor, ECF subfamily